MLPKTIAGSLTLSLLLFARSHEPEESLNAIKGVRIASRIPCDGSTNFQEEVSFHTTFSPGGWERSFRLDDFQAQYCKHVDLYFLCLKHGHGWKESWSVDSLQPAGTERAWLKSCSEWGSVQASEYLLSGWYKEGRVASKQPWKQAAIKQVSASPEIYEFTDPNGGTARVEIKRK